MKAKITTINLMLLVFLLGISTTSYSQAGRRADTDTQQWRYEIEAEGVGVQGTVQVKVWSYSKKAKVAIEQAKKNAVHGVIFKGFTGKSGVPGQRPLTKNPNLENEQKDFFEDFFKDGGKYMKFVQAINDGNIAAGDIMKIGKEYKIGVIVSVNTAELRKDLENAGIIKSLGSGF